MSQNGLYLYIQIVVEVAVENKKTAHKTNSSGRWPHLRPRSLNYYLKTSKIGKKIGNLATSSYFQLREFLAKDIPLPSARDIGDSVGSFVAKPFVRPGDTEAAESERSEDDHKEKLEEAVRKSNEILAEATTVFPFTLFPDTITLDRKKLVLTQRSFFLTSKVLTIQIEEILNVAVNAGPFFGSLHIAIRGLTSEDHFDISFLWRKDAIHLKHMIEGCIIAMKEKIKIERMPREELIRKLVQLGSDTNPEKV